MATTRRGPPRGRGLPWRGCDAEAAAWGADSIIEFDKVVAGYSPSLTILNETTLDARRGEITLLIGPNGAGKSTVLRTLFGMLVPRSGEVRFEGRVINGRSQRDLLADGIAFVPQGRNLFGSLSVRHNLELGGITLPRAELPGAHRGGAAALPAHPRAHRQPGLDDVGRRAEAARGRPRAAAPSARAADRRAVDRPVAEARAGRDVAAAQARRRRHDGADGRAERAHRAQVRRPRARARDGPPRARPARLRAAGRPGPQPPVPRRTRAAVATHRRATRRRSR